MRQLLLFPQGRHHGISFIIGVQAVVAKLDFEKPFVIGHRRKVIQPGKSLLLAILLHPVVQISNLFRLSSNRLNYRLSDFALFVVADSNIDDKDYPYAFARESSAIDAILSSIA